MRIKIVNTPLGDGGNHPGCSGGPQALHDAGLVSLLTGLGHQVTARPMMFSPTLTTADSLHFTGFTALMDGYFPIFIGGDHSISIGTVNGVAGHTHSDGRPLFVLWMDAHADYNTPDISPTGNMHGMSAAFICGEGGFIKLFNSAPRVSIPPANIMLWGTRSIDPDERVLLQKRNVAINDGKLEHWLEKVRAVNGVVHLSFDVDYLDPSVAPGVSTPVLNGPDLPFSQKMMKILRDSGLLCSMDIVELNPLLDNGQTVQAVLSLMQTLFGSEHDTRGTDERKNHSEGK